MVKELLASMRSRFPDYTEDELSEAIRSGEFKPNDLGGLTLHMRLPAILRGVNIQGTVQA